MLGFAAVLSIGTIAAVITAIRTNRNEMRAARHDEASGREWS
jgi:hypothetical protein